MNKNNGPTWVNRRQFFQIVAVAGAAGLLWRTGIDLDKMGLHTVRRSQPMMGTGINFIVCGPDKDQAEAAVDSTIKRMLEVEQLLSRHRTDSELNRLNDTGIVRGASQDLLAVLEQAARVSKVTDGAFDITVLPLISLFEKFKKVGQLPDGKILATALQFVDHRKVVIRGGDVSLAQSGMGITLDGIGKGYVVDQGINSLLANGFGNIYLEAGGDLMVKGLKSAEKPWKIGVQNPRPSQPGKLITLEVSDSAVATSGDYLQFYSSDLRYHHIVNPYTGISPSELASSTVMAPTVAEADALATGTMVLGSEKSLALFDTLPECEGLFISKDSSLHKSKGFVA